MAEVNGVYSFLDVQCSIAGPGVQASLGNGSGASEEGITVAMAGDKNTMSIGADGSPMHSLHASKGGMITVRLLKTSPTNRILQQAYNFQTSGGSANHGQNTIVVSNTQTGDVITGRFCAFKKQPELAYAVDGNHNEWAFDVGKIDQVLGSGSPALSAFGT